MQWRANGINWPYYRHRGGDGVDFAALDGLVKFSRPDKGEAPPLLTNSIANSMAASLL